MTSNGVPAADARQNRTQRDRQSAQHTDASPSPDALKDRGIDDKMKADVKNEGGDPHG